LRYTNSLIIDLLLIDVEGAEFGIFDQFMGKHIEKFDLIIFYPNKNLKSDFVKNPIIDVKPEQ
jgi:hypothetical protein